MRCPSLSEISPPLLSRTGWPWTTDSEQLPDTMPNGTAWPKVSIVTPSYNQDEFLEATIRSVLLQGYPNLEYVIIDGGSTDRSVKVIEKYQSYLSYWVSEPDHGQADAINKGFARATGEIFGWINSDDLYQPDALRSAVEGFVRHPEVALVYGDHQLIDHRGRFIKNLYSMPATIHNWLYGGCNVFQGSTFWRRSTFNAHGPLDDTLVCAMEYPFFYQVFATELTLYIPVMLASFRVYAEQKTRRHNEVMKSELRGIMEQYLEPNPVREQILKLVCNWQRLYWRLRRRLLPPDKGVVV